VAFRTHAQLGRWAGNCTAHAGPHCTAFGPTAFNRGAQRGGSTLDRRPAFSSLVSRGYVKFGADSRPGRRAAHLANLTVGLRHSLCGGSSSLRIGGLKTPLDSTGTCWTASVDQTAFVSDEESHPANYIKDLLSPIGINSRYDQNECRPADQGRAGARGSV
jgi:hypothetical protein